ncbi:MAG: hypothetical protein M9921_10820 [Fimbriimonadaceae bacterium]|nr:hypothetical protein [Fimbriimonadaceae bacterium]
MKVVPFLMALALFAISVGCSGGAKDEPAPEGPAPAVKTADPNMVPPEQRARQGMPGGAPGEGS